LKFGDIIAKLIKHPMNKTKILDMAIIRLTCLSSKNLSDIKAQTQNYVNERNESFKKIEATVFEEQKSKQVKGKTQCIYIKLKSQSITCLSIQMEVLERVFEDRKPEERSRGDFGIVVKNYSLNGVQLRRDHIDNESESLLPYVVKKSGKHLYQRFSNVSDSE
jgi:hypothetical protein